MNLSESLKLELRPPPSESETLTTFAEMYSIGRALCTWVRSYRDSGQDYTELVDALHRLTRVKTSALETWQPPPRPN